VTIPAATEQIDYADLYARWERGNWSATAIDLSQDRVDWRERLTPEQRRGALWLYTLFLHGEDSVAVNLSPYIDAAPLVEQKYFLATQQVDEARHAVFFHRFMHEVVGVGDGSLDDGLRATQAQLTWGHRKTFGRLDRMAAELRSDRSPRMLAKAIAMYHVVVEGTLAQPGQHIIETSLERLDLLPGFREGMRNVAIDEQRHIAFGVKLLADLYRQDPQGTQDAIVDLIREVLQYTLSVPIPPGWDESYTTCFGYSLEDLFEEGARANEARLRAIGLPLDDIAHFPFPMDVLPRAGAAARGAARPAQRADRPRPADGADLLRPAGAQRARRGGAARHDDPVGLRRHGPVVPRDRGPREGRGAGARRQADGAAADGLRGLRRPRRRARAATPARHARAAAAMGRPARAAQAAASVSLTTRVWCSPSVMRQGPIPRYLHGMIEYGAGVLFIAAPFVFGFEADAATAVSIVAGIVVLAVAASTDGPTSLINSIPIPAHLLLDLALAALLVAAPFLFGFSDESSPTAFFIVLGVAHLLITIGTRFEPASER
jgi:hypothetical protein